MLLNFFAVERVADIYFMRIDKLEPYQIASLYRRLFNKGIREAVELNRKNGLPNVISLNGRIFYELPNGDIVDKNPLDELK